MMILKRFFDPKLAQASYLIGDAGAKTAVVIDANRDIEQYLQAAAADSLAITHVTETHIHADFVSGSRELAARTGATLLLSDEGGDAWRYAFARAARAVLLHDGDTFAVGSVRFEAVHTPGHTPEHLMFVVTDTATGEEPLAAVTGDFLFVGDVGRPDLLERAARMQGTMEAGARALFGSLKRLHGLPDHLQIWPGHGAGSACGKGLGSLPQTTLGYERRVNWAFQVADEETFLRRVLEGQPDPPAYFAEMKRINKEGPSPAALRRPPRLTESRLDHLVDAGALVIDTRPASDYASGHVPGSINLPLTRAFTTWAGWLVPYRRDVYLIVDERCPQCLDEAVRDLSLIGLDRVDGYFGADVLERWKARGGDLARIEATDASRVAEQLRGGVQVLDVRSGAEYDAGHIPGAQHIPLGELPRRMDALSRARPTVVHCQTGSRAAIAASLLDARGFPRVQTLRGGFAEWRAAGHPVETGGRESAVASR